MSAPTLDTDSIEEALRRACSAVEKLLDRSIPGSVDYLELRSVSTELHDAIQTLYDYAYDLHEWHKMMRRESEAA